MTAEMLSKKEVFTIVTPLPPVVPRQLAIAILHSHSEVITLNPLVLGHKPIPAPRNAATDEYYSTWYEITERIQYVPGLGKFGSGKISFNGCFHNMPWGLQTHINAPMNIDMRVKYRIEGNQQGYELPDQHVEIGLAQLGAPADGLYLREDIEIKCNFTLVSFVKSQTKAASKDMVARMVKKAQLLEAGVIDAMFVDGKLTTINPNDRSADGRPAAGGSPSGSPGAAPPGPFRRPTLGPGSPRMSVQSAFGYQSSSLSPTPASTFSRPVTLGSMSSAAGFPPQYQQQVQPPSAPPSFIAEMPGDTYYPPQQQQQQQQPQPQQPQRQQSQSPQNQHLQPHPHPQQQPQGPSQNSHLQPLQPPHPAYRVSALDPRWSHVSGQGDTVSQRTSLSSDAGANNHGSGGQPSPGLHNGFASELPSHAETNEEHHAATLAKLDPHHFSMRGSRPSSNATNHNNNNGNGNGNGGNNMVAGKVMYAYNPQDFVRTVTQ